MISRRIGNWCSANWEGTNPCKTKFLVVGAPQLETTLAESSLEKTLHPIFLAKDLSIIE